MTNDINMEAEELEQEAHRLEDDAARLEEKAHEEEKEAHALEDEARRLEREKEHGGGGHDQFVEITMVVNGQPVEIKANVAQPLSEVRHKALEETKNLAQPAENWEIKTEAGELLDPAKKVGDFHFGEKVTLFLSLKAGVAGA